MKARRRGPLVVNMSVAVPWAAGDFVAHGLKAWQHRSVDTPSPVAGSWHTSMPTWAGELAVAVGIRGGRSGRLRPAFRFWSALLVGEFVVEVQWDPVCTDSARRRTAWRMSRRIALLPGPISNQ